MPDFLTMEAIATAFGVSSVSLIVLVLAFIQVFRRINQMTNRVDKHEEECKLHRAEMREEFKQVREQISDNRESLARIEGKLGVDK